MARNRPSSTRSGVSGVSGSLASGGSGGSVAGGRPEYPDTLDLVTSDQNSGSVPACWRWTPLEKPNLRTPYLIGVSMYRWQAYGCAVCGRKFAPAHNSHGERIPHPIDHDHGDGLVRGILCHSCNSSEAIHAHRVHGNCDKCLLFRRYRVKDVGAIMGFDIDYWEFTGRVTRRIRFALEDEFFYNVR